MARIVLCGWELGMRKIDCTKLLMDRSGLCLSEAKAVTDDVLRGNEPVIEVPDSDVESVSLELNELGVETRQIQ